MSATNRGSRRAPNDFYPTPHWCVRALLRSWAHSAPSGNWLDPCAGAGDIIEAAAPFCAPHNVQWHAQDIQLQLKPLSVPVLRYEQDALLVQTADYWRKNPLDGVITNPPFSLAQQFVETYQPLAHVSAWLLRLNFLGSQKRAAFFQNNMPDIHVLPKRPTFRADGQTDATEYAWFVWRRVPSSYGRISVIPLEWCE